jgi:hypothetical protein
MDMFFPLAIEVFGCLHQEVIFFIDVLIWHGQQRALVALLWWFMGLI